MRFALRESTRQNFVEMLGRDHRLDIERGTDRRYVAEQAVDRSPSNAIVAPFRTRWRRLAVVRSWGFGPADLSIGFVAGRGAGFCRVKDEI
jgi:hypothetical protein